MFQPPAKETAASADKEDGKKALQQIDNEVAKETQNGHNEKKKKKSKKDEESGVTNGNSKEALKMDRPTTSDEVDTETEKGGRKKKSKKRKRDEEVVEEASAKRKKLKIRGQQLYLLLLFPI